MDPLKLLNNLDFLKNGDRCTLIEYLKFGIKCTYVKKFPEGDERPCEDKDFIAHKGTREKYLDALEAIFRDLINCGFFNQRSSRSTELTTGCNADMDNELLALIIIMCGENICLKPWNNEAIVRISSAILSSILRLFNCDHSSELISKCHRSNLARDIILILHPNLSATMWKHYPASIICYKWVLEMIKQPDLSSLLPSVLPTSLLLVDDFVTENKILGVKCMHHIVNNTTIAELQFCGHGDVIYSALQPLLRIREADLNMFALPCLISLATKLEINFGRNDVTKWSKFDDILEIFLENMELEQAVDLRNIYISNLELLIRASDFGIIRWTKKLLKVFKEYLEVAVRSKDENAKSCCLKAITKFLEVSKPVSPLYAKSLFLILLIPFNSTTTNCNIQAETSEITLILKRIVASLSESNKNELKIKLQKALQGDSYFYNFYENVQDILNNN